MNADGDTLERPGGCNRRDFLAGLGGAGASLLLPASAFGVPVGLSTKDTLLCIGSSTTEDTGTLHLLRVTDGRCERIGSAPSLRPTALAQHPLQPVVYVANGVKLHANEPRGTVEAFLIDPKNGRLELLARQPLSLSATEPRSITVAADGRRLLIAAFGGGAYNVLPIDAAGIPGPPESVLKQVGRGWTSPQQRSAHPAAVAFHPREPWAIAADFGADRLDLLRVGIEADSAKEAIVADRISCSLASGPCGLALHRDGGFVVVMHGLRPILSRYRIDDSGRFFALGETTLDSGCTALAFHPEHDVLYSVSRANSELSRLEMWRVGVRSGNVQKAAELTLRCGSISAIAAGSEELWLASNSGLIMIGLDHRTGAPANSKIAAELPGACCLTALRDSKTYIGGQSSSANPEPVRIANH